MKPQTAEQRQLPDKTHVIGTGLAECPTCGKPAVYGLMVFGGIVECSICFIKRRSGTKP